MQAHHRLSTPNQRVVLERTTERLGAEKIIERISQQGTWVWRPDAELIFELGPFAPCCGKAKIGRPFFRAQAPASALEHKPVGPPVDK